MNKLNYLIMSALGILIISLAANTSQGGNFTGEDGNLSNKTMKSAEYNYFVDMSPVNYEVIVTYGKLPILQTESQRQNWSDSIRKLGKSLEIELSLNYIYPNGKVITYGENSYGYFVVVFYKNLTIDRALIDEMYVLIEGKARMMGIQDVPVEFGGGGFPMSAIDGRSEAEQKADEEYEKSGRNSYKPEVIATYGKLPQLETKDQRFTWFYKDQKAIIERLRDNMTSYFSPRGPVVGFGANSDGYFDVMINRSSTVGKSLLNEIYGIIDEEAKKRGIHEVPVRFVLGDIVDPAILTEDSNNNTPSTDNKKITSTYGLPYNSVSGFGLFGGLIVLLCVWLYYRQF